MIHFPSKNMIKLKKSFLIWQVFSKEDDEADQSEEIP